MRVAVGIDLIKHRCDRRRSRWGMEVRAGQKRGTCKQMNILSLLGVKVARKGYQEACETSAGITLQHTPVSSEAELACEHGFELVPTERVACVLVYEPEDLSGCGASGIRSEYLCA